MAFSQGQHPSELVSVVAFGRTKAHPQLTYFLEFKVEAELTRHVVQRERFVVSSSLSFALHAVRCVDLAMPSR